MPSVASVSLATMGRRGWAIPEAIQRAESRAERRYRVPRRPRARVEHV